MASYSKGLLIGRFQPFHKGHLYLLQHMSSIAQSFIIGIGSANISDAQNPFSFSMRKKMIEKVLHQEHMNNKVEKIVPLDDFYDDELWFKNVIKIAGTCDVVIGNNEWTNGIFEKRGYRIQRVGFYKRFMYEGEKIRVLMNQGKNWQSRIPDYLVPMVSSHIKQIARIKFMNIAVGGTFDHFHLGHMTLIDKAFEKGKKVTIGIIVKENNIQKELPMLIESFEKRKNAVIEYLEKKNWIKRSSIVPLYDQYGPTLTHTEIDAIVVSPETKKTAVKINQLRFAQGFNPLSIIIIPFQKGSHHLVISSGLIRKGQMNRAGMMFNQLFEDSAQFKLPLELRHELRKPFGIVISGIENDYSVAGKQCAKQIKNNKPTMIITVGDIVSTVLENESIIPDVKIIDYKTQRKIIKSNASMKGRIINFPGYVYSQAADVINKGIIKYLETKNPQTIIIEGEEDLLTLPSILFAPLRSFVLYGQRGLGIVVVEVNEEIKVQVMSILRQFNYG